MNLRKGSLTALLLKCYEWDDVDININILSFIPEVCKYHDQIVDCQSSPGADTSNVKLGYKSISIIILSRLHHEYSLFTKSVLIPGNDSVGSDFEALVKYWIGDDSLNISGPLSQVTRQYAVSRPGQPHKILSNKNFVFI